MGAWMGRDGAKEPGGSVARWGGRAWGARAGAAAQAWWRTGPGWGHGVQPLACCGSCPGAGQAWGPLRGDGGAGSWG